MIGMEINFSRNQSLFVVNDVFLCKAFIIQIEHWILLSMTPHLSEKSYLFMMDKVNGNPIEFGSLML